MEKMTRNFLYGVVLVGLFFSIQLRAENIKNVKYFSSTNYGMDALEVSVSPLGEVKIIVKRAVLEYYDYGGFDSNEREELAELLGDSNWNALIIVFSEKHCLTRSISSTPSPLFLCAVSVSKYENTRVSIRGAVVDEHDGEITMVGKAVYSGNFFRIELGHIVTETVKSTHSDFTVWIQGSIPFPKSKGRKVMGINFEKSGLMRDDFIR